jgi:Xaa-Pro dipeptidase
MTIHLIPWVWGVDGDKTVGISDTIYVTADGCKSFFTLEREITSNLDAPAELSPKDSEPSSKKKPGPDEIDVAAE